MKNLICCRMDLQKLNSIAQIKQLYKISELDPEVRYRIEHIKKVTTRFGDRVIVELEGNIYCYLPTRISAELLSNGERGLTEFREQLAVSTIKMHRLVGLWNPVQFIIDNVPDGAPANDE